MDVSWLQAPPQWIQETWNWIWQEIRWLFSGVGVVAGAALVRRIIRGRPAKTPGVETAKVQAIAERHAQVGTQVSSSMPNGIAEAPVPDRLLWEETVRLLTLALNGRDPKNVLDQAFAHLPNDPRARLRIGGDRAIEELAVDWTRELWDAKCIRGHSALHRLIVACFKDRQEPKVNLRDGFQGLLWQLDDHCAGANPSNEGVSATETPSEDIEAAPYLSASPSPSPQYAADDAQPAPDAHQTGVQGEAPAQMSSEAIMTPFSPRRWPWLLGLVSVAVVLLAFFLGVWSCVKQNELGLAAARDALRKGRYDNAWSHLETIPRWCPSLRAAKHLREITLLAEAIHSEMPDWPSLEGRLQRLSGQQQSEPSLLVLRAELEIKSGRHDDARALLKAALGQDPQHAHAAFVLGYLADLHGDDRSAIDHYLEAVKESPLSPRYRNNLARAYLDAGRTEEALKEYSRISQFPLARAEEALAYWTKGRWPTAADLQRQAIQEIDNEAIMGLPPNRAEWRFEIGSAARTAEHIRLPSAGEKRCYVRLGLWVSEQLIEGGQDEASVPDCEPERTGLRALVAADLCRYLSDSALPLQISKLRHALDAEPHCPWRSSTSASPEIPMMTTP